MWPFNKVKKIEDEPVTIQIRLDMQTEGISVDRVESEIQKRVSLFIQDAERIYLADSLIHKQSFVNSGGFGIVFFQLPKTARSNEIAQQLGKLWEKFSGW